MEKLRARLAGAGGGRHSYGVAFNWDKVGGRGVFLKFLNLNLILDLDLDLDLDLFEC